MPQEESGDEDEVKGKEVFVSKQQEVRPNDARGEDHVINPSIASRSKELAAALGEDKTSQLTLKKLAELREGFADVLAADEALDQRMAGLEKSRKAKKRVGLQTAASAEGLSVKKWTKLLEKCKKELPASDKLIQQVLASLEDRQKSHRVPLANEIDQAEKATLRELDSLDKRCCVELKEDDTVYVALKEITTARVRSHKDPLVKRYKEVVNKVKTISVVELSNFVKEAEKELPANDPLLGQVLALQKAKVMNKTGSKTKAKVMAKERKRKKSSRREGAAAERDLERGDLSLLKPGSPTLLSAVRADVSGAQDSNLYKITLLSIFLLYAGLMYYTMQLVFQVSPFTLNDVVESLFGSDAAVTEEPTQNPPPNVIDPQAGVN